MTIIFIVILLLSTLAWVGQVLSWVAPTVAVKLGLTEPEDAVESTFYADVRSECIVDTFTLWILPLATVLYLLNSTYWPVFGLIGGGIYFYFGGRGILQRVAMTKRNLQIGTAANVKSAFLFLSLWGISGLTIVVLSVMQLSTLAVT